MMIFLITLGTCACGSRERTVQIQDMESELQQVEEVSKEPETEALDNPSEEDSFTYDEAVSFIIEADAAVHEFMGVTGDTRDTVYREEEIYEQLEKYFDESLIHYVLYVYQIRESESGYIYNPYDEYNNYWVDVSEDMTKLSENAESIEVGVTFKHTWQIRTDEEIVPVRLENTKDGWKNTSISQWYNDFRYEYMHYISFDPPYFTEEMAHELITCFGTDEEKNGASLIADTDENGYILAQSSERILSEEEISGLSKYELFLAVQEIYARHGKKFSDPVLYWRFTGQDWYEPYHDIFSEETLSEIEAENIRLFVKEGKLGEEADSGYGSLYPVMVMEEGAIAEEEAACMIYHAFEMAGQVITFDEKNLIEEESQDVIQVYSLGEYSDEEILQEYMSEWFSNEVFDYLMVIYSTWNGLYKGDDGKYTISREYTYGGNAYVPYFFRKAVIQEADENKMTVEMSFYYYGSNKTEQGEIIFEKRDNGWIITSLSVPYYDALYQEYLQE